LVAKAIVQAVQQQNPPGRFIKLTQGDGASHDSIWKPITYAQAVNKTSQALREKDSSSSNNNKFKNQNEHQQSTEQTALDIAKEAARRIKLKDGEESEVESLANLTSATIQSAGLLKNPTSNRFAMMNHQNATCGGKRKSPALFVKPSWWRMGSPLANGVIGIPNVNGGSTGETNAGVTPGTDANGSNKRMKIMEHGGVGKGVGGGVIARAISSIDPLPLPTEPLEGRQSTLFRFLNSTGIFGRGNSDNVSHKSATTVDVNPTPLPNPTTSPKSSQVAFSSFQSQPSGMFSFSRTNQQQERSSFDSSQDVMGRTTVQQLQKQQQIKIQQQAFGNITTSRLDDDDEEEMQEMPTTGLPPPELMMMGDNDIAAASAAPPTKGLTTQVSDWLTSFFPTTTSGNSSQENDFAGAAVPPPPGGGDGVTEPSLARSISSTIFGLVESPSLLMTNLKSGISSFFGDPFSSVPAPPSSPMRPLPSAVSQQQHGQQNFRDSGVYLGNTASKQDSLLDDFEETPMEKDLRNAKGEETPIKPVLGTNGNAVSFD